MVTHLAQVAAQADHQIEVRKSEQSGRTRSEVAALDAEDRVVELSRMLSGQPRQRIGPAPRPGAARRQRPGRLRADRSDRSPSG